MLFESTITDTENRNVVQEYYCRYCVQGWCSIVLLQILRTGMFESTITNTENRDVVREQYCRYCVQGWCSRVLLQILKTGILSESTIVDT